MKCLVKDVNNMPIKKKEVKEVVVKKEVVEEKAIKNLSFNIYDIYGKYVRTYSTELHGEKAEVFAKQFAKKINGTIK